MKQLLAVAIFLFFFLFQPTLAYPQYTGSRLVQLIDFNTETKDYKPVKELWALDKNFESTTKGLKLSVNAISGKIESVLVAGETFSINGKPFSRYNSVLPYKIQLKDDSAKLNLKLGDGQKLLGRNALKYYQDKYAIEVVFMDDRFKTIHSIRFLKEAKPFVPPVMKLAPPVLANVNAVTKYQLEEKKPEAYKTVSTAAAPAKVENVTPFKRAILDVFKAYRESNFSTIRDGLNHVSNFWNYKFAYRTNHKIPGEKFNMLYSFPFASSQLDFVSVLHEGEETDAAFQTTYKAFEKKLMENFPAKDGWVASCIANKESKTLSDLEFRNDKYGAVVLDYSKAPSGKSVLYLRFLFFSS